MSVKATTSIKGGDLEFGTATSANPASIAAGAEGSIVLTISGADTSDLVFVSPRALAAGLALVEATVTDTDEVTVKVLNTSGSAVDDAASDVDYLLVKVAA